MRSLVSLSSPGRAPKTGRLRHGALEPDPGLMALLAELRAHERQAAEELGQWVEPHEEHNGVIWSNSSMLAASARDKRPSEGLARRRKQLRRPE